MNNPIYERANPGPIKAVGTFMYQLNVADGERSHNLWGGSLHAQNRHDPVHVQKAVKLFLAAEDLLAALKELADDIADRFDMSSPSTNPGMKNAVAEAYKAIAKAEG